MMLFRLIVLLSALLCLFGQPGQAQRIPRALAPAGRLLAEAPLRRPVQTAVFRPRQAVRYGWDVGQNTWNNPLLDQLTYTSQGWLEERITADSATVTAFQRVLLSYNAQGNVLEEITQTGNGLPWINQFRYQSTYDAQNQLIEELSQTWSSGAWQTTDGYRYQNTYTGPVLTEQVVQRYNAGTYENETRFQYQLSNGQWMEAVAQRWDGAAWVNEERLTDLVWQNWQARQLSAFRVQSWLNSGQWIDFQRSTLTYSPTGTVVQLVEEAQAGGNWQNFGRYTEPVDAQGNDLGYRQEDWLNGGWVLTNELRAQLRYDSQNRLTRRTEQLYSPITAQFANRQRINYGNFQDIITAATPPHRPPLLRLYPVPATHALHLETTDLPAPLAGNPEIRTLTGQLVQRPTVLSRQGTLHIILPTLAPGAYLLYLPTSQGRIVQRFVRE